MRNEYGGWRGRWPALALVALVFLAYGNAFGQRFVYDDLPLIAWNERLHDPSPGKLLGTPYWGEARGTALYRPLVLVSFALNYSLGGASTWGYTCVNLLLHALASLLLAALARELGAGRRTAWVAGALFALHPVHSEAVTWISGRAELLCASAGLAFLLVHRRAGAGARCAAGAAFLAALAAKEHAVTLLGVVGAMDLLLPARDAAGAVRSPRVRLGDYALYLGLLGLYLAARLAVLGPDAWRPAFVEPLDNPILPPLSSALGTAYGAEAPVRLFSRVAVLGEWVRLLCWPARLSVDYSYDALPLVRQAGDPRFLLGLVGAGLSLAGAFALRRQAPRLSFALAFLLLTGSLASNLFLRIGTICAERLLYLPSAGFVLAAALAWGRLSRGSPPRRRLAVLVLVLLLAAGCGRIRARNRDWHDRLSLWSAAVTAVPRSAKAQSKLGQVLAELGEAYAAAGEPAAARRCFAGARGHLARALEIYPEQRAAAVRLPRLALRLGEPEAALRAFRHLVRVDPPGAVVELRRAVAETLPGVRGRGALEAELRAWERRGLAR